MSVSITFTKIIPNLTVRFAVGARPRVGTGAADVRVPCHSESTRVHPGRAAAGSGARTGRTRAQVRQRPKRESCRK